MEHLALGPAVGPASKLAEQMLGARGDRRIVLRVRMPGAASPAMADGTLVPGGWSLDEAGLAEGTRTRKPGETHLRRSFSVA